MLITPAGTFDLKKIKRMETELTEVFDGFVAAVTVDTNDHIRVKGEYLHLD